MGQSRKKKDRSSAHHSSDNTHRKLPLVIGSSLIAGIGLLAYVNYKSTDAHRPVVDSIASVSISKLEQNILASASTRTIPLGEVQLTPELRDSVLSEFSQQVLKAYPGASQFQIVRSQRSLIATCDADSIASQTYLNQQLELTRRVKDYFGLGASIDIHLLSAREALRPSPPDHFVAYVLPKVKERFHTSINFLKDGKLLEGFVDSEKDFDDAETQFNYELQLNDDGTAKVLQSAILRIIIPMGDHPSNRVHAPMEYLHHASRDRIARGLRTSAFRPGQNGQYVPDLDTEMHFNEAVVHGCGLAALEELHLLPEGDCSKILSVYSGKPKYARVPEFLEIARREGARKVFSAYLEDKRE